MKKIIVGVLIAVCGMSAFAKGSSSIDDSTNVVGACMIQVDDSTASRFVNVNYIRTIEIVRKDKYGDENPRMVTLQMASNYSARSSYSILYPTEEAAKQALKDFAKAVNTCGK